MTNQKSPDKKKTGFRKMTADDLRRGIDLSKSISGFKVIETKSNENKTKELDWEKEFDNDCWDTKDGVMTVTYLMKGGNKVGKLTERVTKEMIKSYVKIRLTQQRTELLEEIKTRVDTWGGFEDDGGNLCHYDSEILEWLEEIKKL